MAKKIVIIIAFFSFVSVIWLANWALATFGFISIGFGLMAGAGVLFAGAAFSIRDWLQELGGKRLVILAIIVGATLSFILGSTERIAIASGIAFLFSEAADMFIYTPLRNKSRVAAVGFSNTIGSIIDSGLFLWIALGSLTWSIWAGQVLGKLYVMGVSLILMEIYVFLFRNPRPKLVVQN